MHEKMKLYTPIIALLMVLCALLCVLTLTHPTLFFISAALTCSVFVAVLVMLRRVGKQTRNMLREIGQGVLQSLDGNLTELPIPVMAVYDNGEIIWYNELCYQQVFDGREMYGEHAADVLVGVDIRVAMPSCGYDVTYGSKLYTAYIARRPRGQENISVICFFENTRLKLLAEEYHRTKPTVALVVVDNYDELMQDYKDAERAQIMGQIEYVIERYMTANHSYFIRISRDRYLVIIQEQGYESMLAGRFNILDQVRELKMGDRMRATLSIGVGRDAADLFEGEAMARQAVDMCLGRGGDQAAIKTQNGYEFYGGVSKAIEKRTKVKTRIIAAALSELMESADNVIVMGHRFADLDSIGAAVGILATARAMSKPSFIVLDRSKNLAEPLVVKLLASGYSAGNFVHPAEAMSHVTAGTLLVITDSHVPYILESEELYRACKQVAVIDHHRKLVNHIDNAVIFYHEPYASSASEMVAELAQYFPTRPQLTRAEAEAMMAGIMLDTKNFVLRTGVRTFEAAAHLRRLGADTVEVRKLFASSMEAYQQKTALVSAAEVYKNCAIAVSQEHFKDINLIAPQAADELMGISGVDASFIIFIGNNQVNVSARSMGAFNVQVIMERLGGGGHLTMAGAQFTGQTIENVRKMLIDVIDGYLSEINQKHGAEPFFPQVNGNGNDKQ